MPEFLDNPLSLDARQNVFKYLEDKRKREEEQRVKEETQRQETQKREETKVQLERQQEQAKEERKFLGKQSPARYVLPEMFNTLSKTGEKIAGFTETVIQETLRNAMSGFLTASAFGYGTPREIELDPRLKVNELLFGDVSEPLKAIETRMAEGEIKARDVANAIEKDDILTFLNEGQKKELSFFIKGSAEPEKIFGGASPLGVLIGGMIFADLTPIGGSKKAFSALAKTDDLIEVGNILKKTGMADDIIEKIAPRIAETKSPKAVEGIINSAKKEIPTQAIGKDLISETNVPEKIEFKTGAQRAADDLLDTPEDITKDLDFLTEDLFKTGDKADNLLATRARNAADELKKSPTPENIRAARETREIANIRSKKLAKPEFDVKPLADDLTQEARKYKSADEFVGSQPKLFHGTGGKFDTPQSIQQLRKGGTEIESSNIGGNSPFVHLTEDKGLADSYAKARQSNIGGKASTKEFFVEGKILDKTDNTSIGFNTLERGDSALIKELRDGGYAGVKFTDKGPGGRLVDTVAVFPENIKTKSQLTDIWNKANGQAGFIKPSEFLEAAKKPARKLKEGISGSFKKVSTRLRGIRLGKTPTAQEARLLKPQTKLPVKAGTLTTLKQKMPQKAIKQIAKQVGDDPKQVSRVGRGFREIKTKLIEHVQNEAERVRQLVKRKDVKIDDASDPYLKITLYPGRVGAKIEKANVEAKSIVKDLKKTKIDRKDVSDFLQARHAPERNKALGEGAAGITTKEAQDKLAKLSKNKELVKIADRVQKINDQTLEVLNESGVISDDLYKGLRKKYKTHVPLNRIFEETEDVGQALSGKGFDVRSTGIKRAFGSEREVSDIMTNVIANYEQAVLRAEKNVVDQATLQFVRNNKDILGDLLEVVRPKAVGKTFEGKAILEKTTDPSIIQMFENGKRVWIKVKDPNLAIALRGVGKEKLGPMLNGVAKFTRLYSGLATRFNPEFFLPNKIRDLQETAVYLASQKGTGFKGATKAFARDPASVKDVIAGIRGKNTKGAKLYQEMVDAGGTTGGFGLSTRKNVELNMEKLEKLANSKTKSTADRLIQYVDDWNMVFEDSTRLSVYKTARDQGLSVERAAEMAKEASINFNRMGKGGPLINSLYMFSNASIQGSVKMLKSLRNPKVLGATVATVGTAVATVNEYNDKADPEWRNKVSRWDRLNGMPIVLPSQDGKFRYFTIPVSWGLKPIKVMSEYAYDAVSGEEFDINRMTEDTLTAMAEAYNPAGGTDLVSALVPTILDVPVELSRNRTWYGGKIRPDYDPNAPSDIQYFSSLDETTLGKQSIKISEFLNESLGASVSPANINYAAKQYSGGVGRAAGRATNVLGQAATREPLPLDEYCFAA